MQVLLRDMARLSMQVGGVEGHMDCCCRHPSCRAVLACAFVGVQVPLSFSGTHSGKQCCLCPFHSKSGQQRAMLPPGTVVCQPTQAVPPVLAVRSGCRVLVLYGGVATTARKTVVHGAAPVAV